ncbi:MAG TPA: isoprenyl transferase [Defluviitaleaceae bacterium]|nr:isoprenyl transferase [Candidatus Epulonipiscium sp.]HOQ16488.1 isoprenyl transferase [Defluviitaleaceae bacterium]HQD51235.1 isoprenyl transferase [Defluviitaleaceae bacterium]
MDNHNYKNKLKMDSLPKHIAIIMDGNGRWAKQKQQSRSFGHKAGSKALERIVKAADSLGIAHLTVYAFSTENWKRPKEEVNALMKLLSQYLNQYLKDTKDNNVKIDVIGDITKFDEEIQRKIEKIQELTLKKNGLNLHIALNYGSRDEMTRAVKKIVTDVMESKIDLNSIDDSLISSYLDTKEIPDPDLLIRTSGEKRISNFLLWQIAYTEFYFTDKLWPDFDENDLYKAIFEYQNRERRFGTI